MLFSNYYTSLLPERFMSVLEYLVHSMHSSMHTAVLPRISIGLLFFVSHEILYPWIPHIGQHAFYHSPPLPLNFSTQNG